MRTAGHAYIEVYRKLRPLVPSGGDLHRLSKIDISTSPKPQPSGVPQLQGQWKKTSHSLSSLGLLLAM